MCFNTEYFFLIKPDLLYLASCFVRDFRESTDKDLHRLKCEGLFRILDVIPKYEGIFKNDKNL